MPPAIGHLRKSFVLLALLLAACSAFAQTGSTSTLPRLIKFSGVVEPGTPAATFSIYDSQESQAPLWTETQTLSADEAGHFTVLLGSTTDKGLPSELFTSGEARWIGVKAGDAAESARVLLVSVPYALKAGDAETLGGKPLSAFLLADSSVTTSSTAATADSTTPTVAARLRSNIQSGTPNAPAGVANQVAKFVDSTTLTNSVMFDDGTNVGIGTTTPHQQLELTGNLRLPATTGNTAGILYQGPNLMMHTAPFNSGNFFVGVNAGNLTNTGTANMGIGTLALTSVTTGNSNMAFGPSALANLTAGLQNTAIGTQALFNVQGNNNAGIGFNALISTTSGSANVGVGTVAGQTNATGTFNTFIGYNSDATASALSNATAIGANARVSASNSVILGNGANVGVGISSPAFAGIAGGVHVFNPGAAALRLQTSGSSYEMFAVNNGNFGLFDDTSSTYRLYLTNTGTLGIGTTSPTVLTGTGLHINGPSSALRLQSAANAYEFISNGANGNLGLFDVGSSAYRFYVTAAGNVGINNTTPLAKLDVSQPAAGSGTFTIGTPPPSAIHGDTTATSGFITGILGTATTVDGFGVLGENLASSNGSGNSAGVRGISANTTTLGTGVWGDALETSGDNEGVFGRSASSAGTGVHGQATATSGDAVGVYGQSASSSGTGVFGEVSNPNAGSPIPAGVFGRAAAGVAGLFAVTNNSANLLIGQNASSVNVFRVSGTGAVFGSGAFNTSGADFAESVDVLEKRSAYEPGDVIAIDTTGIRRFSKSSAPYSTLVAGIYSTKPGVIASPHAMDEVLKNTVEIPLAVVGIVPCKVTNENGDINAGDLLVSSSKAGYAMKGTDRNKMTGAVVGKALQAMHAKDGVIEVLVSLQ